VIGEAADTDMVPSPPVVPATLAPAATEVVAVPVGERPVAASVGTAYASAPSASEEVGVDARSAQPSGSLIAVRWSPEARR
jgi:ABC-type Fe3+-hydroxamate transport system substrate-binding protein